MAHTFREQWLIKWPVVFLTHPIYPNDSLQRNVFLIDLKESNVSLKLTIVETVGFGDQINKEDR